VALLLEEPSPGASPRSRAQVLVRSPSLSDVGDRFNASSTSV
jgi:hypothetical protein